MTTIALIYLYVAGVLNGLLICGLYREANGEMPRPSKVLFATVLWPLLFPWLWLPRAKK